MNSGLGRLVSCVFWVCGVVIICVLICGRVLVFDCWFGLSCVLFWVVYVGGCWGCFLDFALGFLDSGYWLVVFGSPVGLL